MRDVDPSGPHPHCPWVPGRVVTPLRHPRFRLAMRGVRIGPKRTRLTLRLSVGVGVGSPLNPSNLFIHTNPQGYRHPPGNCQEFSPLNTHKDKFKSGCPFSCLHDSVRPESHVRRSFLDYFLDDLLGFRVPRISLSSGDYG